MKYSYNRTNPLILAGFLALVSTSIMSVDDLTPDLSAFVSFNVFLILATYKTTDINIMVTVNLI